MKKGKAIQHIFVLCTDCKKEVLHATPKIGVADTWDGLLICTDCAAKKIAAMKAKVSTT